MNSVHNILTVQVVKAILAPVNMNTRKLRQKEELRSQILKAARRIVASEGFAALTMRRLAADIEYSPGTIYLYFASRDEIALELCREGYRKLLSYMKRGGRADPLIRLQMGLHAYAQYALDHPEMYRMSFMEAPKFAHAALDQAPTERAAGEPGMQAFGFLVESFDKLRAQGRLATLMTSQQLAEVFWTSAHGIVSLKITHPAFPSAPAQDLLHLSLDCLLNGILCPDEEVV